MLITLAAVTDHVRARKLRALAVTTPYHSAALPDVPTVAEAGLPGFSIESWQGDLAPTGTPAAIVAKLNRDIQAVIDQLGMRAELEDMGFEVAGGAPSDLRRTLTTERLHDGCSIQTAGITLRWL